MFVVIFQCRESSWRHAHLRFVLSLLYKKPDYFITISDTDLLDANSADVCLLHDNRFREFSAYQAAWTHALAVGASEIIVINETVSSHHIIDAAAIKAFRSCCLKASELQTPIVVGDVDHLNEAFIDDEFFVKDFISTYLMYFNPTSLMLKFEFLSGAQNLEKFCAKAFHPNDKRLTTVAHRKTEQHKFTNLIEKWLHLPGEHKKWYGHQELNIQNFEFMRLKFLSLLIENNISRVLSDKGVLLLDFEEDIQRSIFEKQVFKVRLVGNSIKIRARKLLGLPMYDGAPLNCNVKC